MTRAQTIGVSLASMLILFLADSTASAQRRPCYVPARPQVRCYPTPSCTPRRFQAMPAAVQGMYNYSPSRGGYNSYNGSCSGTHVPSYGSNVYSPGMPLVHRQIAGRIALENRLRAVHVYFQRRLLNEDYRRQLRRLKVARIRERYETQKEISSMKDEFADVIEMNQQRAEELAQRYAPKRLSASEHNQLTGAIAWPLLFQEYPQFAEDRARIDALFAQRTLYNCGALSRHCVEIGKAAERMKLGLKGMQRELDGTMYMAAKRFLESLAYEARFPVQPSVAQVAAK